MGMEFRMKRIESSKKPETDLHKRMIRKLEEGRYGYEGISYGGEYMTRRNYSNTKEDQDRIVLSTKELKELIDSLPTDVDDEILNVTQEIENNNRVEEPIVETELPIETESIESNNNNTNQIEQNDDKPYMELELDEPKVEIEKKDSSFEVELDEPIIEMEKASTIEEQVEQTEEINNNVQPSNSMPSFEDYLMNQFNTYVQQMANKYGERYIPDMTDSEYNDLLRYYCDAYGKSKKDAIDELTPYRNNLKTNEIEELIGLLQDSVEKLKSVEGIVRESDVQEQQRYMELYIQLKKIYNKPNKDRSSIEEIVGIHDAIMEYTSKYGRTR